LDRRGVTRVPVKPGEAGATGTVRGSINVVVANVMPEENVVENRLTDSNGA